MTLLDKLKSVGESVNKASWKTLDCAVDAYNYAYETHPRLTSYISTAVGTVGGDIIAKRFAEGENVELRDVAFTAGASIAQAYFYPKLIPLAEKIVNKPLIKKAFEKVRINTHWAKAITLTALFFPINMLYWNFLSVKNKSLINLKTNLEGAKTIAEASIPYLGVDYVVANKIDKKYALPVWSAAELGWNTYVALQNYVVKRLFGAG